MLFKVALALTAMAALAQQNSATLPDGTVDLNAPILQQHASDPRLGIGALPDDIVQNMQSAAPYAARKGLNTTGLSWRIGAGLPMVPVPGASARILKKETCEADTIMIGSISDKQSHLMTGGHGVYTDYAFNPQQTLKGTRAKQIVVTQGGGRVENVPTGVPGFTTIDVENEQYPRLKVGTTYLVFLHRIAASGAYIAPNRYGGTLVANNGQWMIANAAYFGMVVPELAQGTLENNIASWLMSCQ